MLVTQLPATRACRVVDLDDPAAAESARAAWSPADPVAIGVASGLRPEHGPLLDRLALTLVADPTDDPRAVAVPDPGAAADALERQVRARPRAAWTLDGLLRTVAGSVGVAEGVIAESLAYSTLLAGAEFREWLAAQPARRPRAAGGEPVRLDRDDDRLRVRLDDPGRRNAFSSALRGALVDALEMPRWDPTLTRVELSGAGPCFSSGGDLAEFGRVADPPTGHALRMAAHPGLAVAALTSIVEARVHGPCIGAGVEVPAFAGRVVAEQGTTFRLPEVAMGLVPGAGGTVSLTRRIGRWRTAYLCLSGAEIDLATALAWGLVDDVG